MFCNPRSLEFYPNIYNIGSFTKFRCLSLLAFNIFAEIASYDKENSALSFDFSSISVGIW